MQAEEYNKAIAHASNILNRPEYRLLKQTLEPDQVVNHAWIFCYENGVVVTLDILTRFIKKSINSENSSHIKSSPKLYQENRRKIQEYQRQYSKLLTDGYLRTCLKNAGKDYSKEAIIEKRRRITLRREGKGKYEIIVYEFPVLPNGAVLIADIPGFTNCIGYCISVDGVFTCKERGYLLHSFWMPKKISETTKKVCLYSDKGKSRTITFKGLLKRAIKAQLIANT